jgi:hypothetical protein
MGMPMDDAGEELRGESYIYIAIYSFTRRWYGIMKKQKVTHNKATHSCK